jgi:hypothetical protein
MNPKAAEVVAKLLLELATEFDLHYDDEELPALKEGFDTIKEGVAALQSGFYPVPPDVLKIVDRFNRTQQ